MNTILVTGATGAQGGSVARHLLKDGSYRVRCLTRNPQSEKAQQLQQLGAEIVQGDLGDKSSIENALRGCDRVFGVTNFWEHFGGEFEHGKNLLEAVENSDVQHFVFSTLPNYHKLSNGELEVPHCDIKAQLEEMARAKNLPATFVHVAFYYENFLSFFPPQKQDDGSYTFGFPQGDTPLAAYSVEDTGGVVAAIFAQPEKFKGQVVGIVGDDLPCSEYAATLTRVLDKCVVYNHIPREVYVTFGFPGAEELGNMFDVQRRFIPSRAKDAEQCRALYPAMQSFDTWAQNNRESLLAAMK